MHILLDEVVLATSASYVVDLSEGLLYIYLASLTVVVAAYVATWLSYQDIVLKQFTVLNLPVPASFVTLSDVLSDHVELVEASFQVLLCTPLSSGRFHSTTRCILSRTESPLSISTNVSRTLDEKLELGLEFLLNRFKKESVIDLSTTQVSITPSINAELVFPDDPFIKTVTKDEDQGNTIWCSYAVLAKFGLLNHDWVKIRRVGSKKPFRACKVSAIASEKITSKISCILAFQLGFHAHEICTLPTTSPCIDLEVKLIPEFKLCKAKSVTIAKVGLWSSFDGKRLTNSLILTKLQQYFKQVPRLLALGDIIGLEIDEESSRICGQVLIPSLEEAANVITNADYTAINGTTEDKKYHRSYTSSQQQQQHQREKEAWELAAERYFALSRDFLKTNRYVWFKVTQIVADLENSLFEDDGIENVLLIDPEFTRVTQSGVERSFIPLCDSQLWKVDPRKGNHLSLISKLRSVFQAIISSTSATELKQSNSVNWYLPNAVLLHGAHGIGKTATLRKLAVSLGVHFVQVNCYQLIGDTEIKTEAALTQWLDRLTSTQAGVGCVPCMIVLKNVESFGRKSTFLETGQESPLVETLKRYVQEIFPQQLKSHGHPVLFVATTSDKEKLSQGLIGLFTYVFQLSAPDQSSRRYYLESLTRNFPSSPDVDLDELAKQTAALVPHDLRVLAENTLRQATERMFNARVPPEHANLSWEDLLDAGLTITMTDWMKALEESRSLYSNRIGAPKIPNVTWDDVGGLASVKQDILDTVQLPLQHPELFNKRIKPRSGVLLYGPPGTGKTLLAKAVATSCSLNFFSVKGPELLNMYIGESEANVRRVFQRARDAKPCVIFFDELDSIAPKRGEKGDSGGVMDRIVSQLLAELDGMGNDEVREEEEEEGGGGSGGKGGGVFVIGATNRPDLLDPALLRPGRFDKLLYLGVSEDHSSQVRIMRALTRKFVLDETVDMEKIAEKCTFNFTGADFYALCSDAMLKAMIRTANCVEANAKASFQGERKEEEEEERNFVKHYLEHKARPEELETVVKMEDFEKALEELNPSVSMQELEYYTKIRQQFEQSVTTTTTATTPNTIANTAKQ